MRTAPRALAAAGLAALWLLAAARPAAACSCARRAPCEAVGAADAVFVGTVASQRVYELDGKFGDRDFRWTIQASRFHVEEAFSGLGGAAEVEVETEQSTTCSYSFTPGLRYLVYASRRGEGPEAGRLSTGFCTRTARVEEAAEDLEYLRGPAARGGAVVEGEVGYLVLPLKHDAEPFGADTVGVTTVVAEGAGRRAEARVSPGGRFQFRGLPPGKYRLTVPLPDVLTVYDDYDPDIAEELGIKDQREIEVPARGCVNKHLSVVDNGRLSGRVTDAEGQPVAGLRVELRRPREPEGGGGGEDGDEDDERLGVRTDEDGQYSFKGLAPGRYLIGVRIGRRLAGGEPAAAFRRTFYPGVTDEREAVVVSLGRGQQVTRRDFQLGPRLRARTIRGVVVSRDGRAAPGVSVRYQARTDDGQHSSHTFVETDGRGRFAIRAYEGTSYLVGAWTKNCSGPDCLHAHEAEVGPTGATRPVRLVLDQPGSNCDRCRDYDESEEGKP